MHWDEFYKSVSEGRFESVYLFAGPEELNKRRALAALRENLLPAGLEAFNDATLENCSAQDIIEAAEMLPAMCERRVVVVRDWKPLISEATKKEAADIAAMLEWLKDPPDTCSLVFYVTEDLKNKKKICEALMKMPGYVPFDRLNKAQLSKWCAQHLRKVNKRLTPEALRELSLRADLDLTRIDTELQKLIAFTGDAAEIGVEDVRAVVTPSPEYVVYDFRRHLLAGELKEAKAIANVHARSDQDASGLIALLTGQLRTDAHIKHVMEARGDMKALLKGLRMEDWKARRVQEEIRPVPADALTEYYLQCMEASYSIRSGRLDARAALDMLMLKIASSRKATKTSQASSKR